MTAPIDLDARLTEAFGPSDPATEALIEASIRVHNQRYLLWSNKHNAWWCDGGWGYTQKVDKAGRFTEAEALRYVAQAAQAGFVDQATVMVVDRAGVPS